MEVIQISHVKRLTQKEEWFKCLFTFLPLSLTFTHLTEDGCTILWSHNYNMFSISGGERQGEM